MVTKMDKETRESYKILFAELSTLLMGYVEVKTYTVPTTDAPAVEYYYRDDENSGFNYVFKQDESINSIESFTEALAKHKLYVKAHKKNSTDGWSGEDIGFVDSSVNLEDFQGISTIEEYLSWLAQLKELNDEYVLRFSRVPLIEECFKIDANTRAITIPTEFRKNGVGVQGDDVAEDVYFIIDRFFDVVDFNNCDIYVKWETPKTKKKGVFEVLYKDIKTEPGSIIFGWPITSNVAGEAGSLKFSIQLIQREIPEDKESKIIYSFNTLTANVTIQNSIGIDLSDTLSYDVDDVGTRLIDRIKYSEIVGGAVAASPEFIEEPEEKEYDLTEENPSVELIAQAISADAGAISYNWKRIDLDADNNPKTDASGKVLSGEKVEGEMIPVEVNIDNLQVGQVYYYYDGDISGTGTRYVVPVSGVSSELQGKKFAKLVSCYTVKDADIHSVTGLYYVSANNRITNSVAATTSTKRAKFPRPVASNIDPIKTSNEEGFFFDKEGKNKLSVTAKHLKEEVQTYQWKYKKTAEEKSYEEIAEATDSTYIVEKESGKGSGYYSVDVTNSRNGESVTTIGDSPVRVTSEPIALTWKRVDFKIMYNKDITESSKFTAELSDINNETEFDSVSVAWYVYESIGGSEINNKIVDYTLISDPVNNKSFDLIFTKEVQDKIKAVTNNDLIAYYYPSVKLGLNDKEVLSVTPTVSNMFKVEPFIESEPSVEKPMVEEEETEKLFFED